MTVYSVTQLCPTLSDPVDCREPTSSVHGIFQARILQWVAFSYSRTVYINQSGKLFCPVLTSIKFFFYLNILKFKLKMCYDKLAHSNKTSLKEVRLGVNKQIVNTKSFPETA